MNKKILAVCLVVICLSITAGGTLSYLTSESVTNNVITTGNVKIELEEKQELTPGVETDFPAAGLSGAMPGDKISKIVRVKNTGTTPAWTRIDVKTTIKSGTTDLPTVLSNGEDAVMITPLTGWTKGSDGYYYYENELAAGDRTPPLFREVKINPLMGNTYQECEISVLVSAHAVQSAHNGTTVSEAAGWPVP